MDLILVIHCINEFVPLFDGEVLELNELLVFLHLGLHLGDFEALRVH